MRDINYPLRASYYNLLAGNLTLGTTVIPFYSFQPPDGEVPDTYVLITSVSNSGFNDDVTNYTNTQVVLMICTRRFKNNSGADADNLAGQIFSLIYPSPQLEKVTALGSQVLNTTLIGDITIPNLTDGAKRILNRILTFQHIIVHGAADTLGNIYYGVQDDTSDPTDFTHSLSGNANNTISIDYGGIAVPKVYWLWFPKTSDYKTQWQDLFDTGNSGFIGGDTDLFEVRTLIHNTVEGWLHITRYVTGFNGDSAQVKYS